MQPSNVELYYQQILLTTHLYNVIFTGGNIVCPEIVNQSYIHYYMVKFPNKILLQKYKRAINQWNSILLTNLLRSYTHALSIHSVSEGLD